LIRCLAYPIYLEACFIRGLKGPAKKGHVPPKSKLFRGAFGSHKEKD